MIDQINELPEYGPKSSPETSRYTQNKWICRKEKKNHNKLYFLHLVDMEKIYFVNYYQSKNHKQRYKTKTPLYKHIEKS